MTLSNIAAAVLIACGCMDAAQAAVELVAYGSISGTYQDLSSRTAPPLENGVAGNLLGGFGSGLAYAGGTTFLALPDRGPNAVPFNAASDDTASYIPRFQTINLALAANPDYDASAAASLPLVLTPTLRNTTLLSSPTPLVYGDGASVGLTNGRPALNRRHTFYFSGRSDNSIRPSCPPTPAMRASTRKAFASRTTA